jgi:hypothetical protein
VTLTKHIRIPELTGSKLLVPCFEIEAAFTEFQTRSTRDVTTSGEP